MREKQKNVEGDGGSIYQLLFTGTGELLADVQRVVGKAGGDALGIGLILNAGCSTLAPIFRVYDISWCLN